MNYDPEEIVTLNGVGDPMTLRTAIAKVMALHKDKRFGSTIFSGEGQETRDVIQARWKVAR